MRVVWTRQAIRDLEAIHAYVSIQSAAYADRVVDRLTRRVTQIGEFPSVSEHNSLVQSEGEQTV